MNPMTTQKQIEANYLDLCEAFDSVIVALLIHKSQIMGINQQITDGLLNISMDDIIWSEWVRTLRLVQSM